MFRVIGLALAIAVAASIISGGNKYVIYVAFFGALVVIVVPLLAGSTVLKCRHCRKRVKLGATACHHCGRSTARDAPGGA